jgi:hypothetical protein
MINQIRNTVLSIISKDNRGYITPEEFNQFARQSQMELFEQYFYDYSNNLNKTNARLHNSGYSDITGRLSEVLDRFLEETTLVYNGTSDRFYMPGDDPLNPNELKPYRVIRLTYNGSKEIEKVSQQKILNLLSSNLTTPTTAYPVYALYKYNDSGTAGIDVRPTSITSNVSMLYVRHPLDPKWTYTSLSGGQPIFNQSASDYQDFELPLSDGPRLVVKICAYSGVSIREADVVQLMNSEEVMDIQQKN